MVGEFDSVDVTAGANEVFFPVGQTDHRSFGNSDKCLGLFQSDLDCHI